MSKNFIQLKVFFLFIVGALYGAQMDEDCSEKDLDVLAMSDVIVRPMEPFNVGDDKQGFHHTRKITFIRLDARFRAVFEGIDEISFDDVAAQAKTIYGRDQKDWRYVLDVVREHPFLDIDYIGKRFVKRPTPVQKSPTESIESAIFRIDAASSEITNKDFVLILYSKGYRDYTARSVIAKRLAMIGAGFCPKGLRRTNNLQKYWHYIDKRTDQEVQKFYCCMDSQDIDVVFQMIYMKKHGLIKALAQEVERDGWEFCAEAIARQNAVLTYLKERADQPCKCQDIIKDLRGHYFPRGVIYEIASLVFLGKAVVTCNLENATFTLVSGGTLLTTKEEESDELALFKNVQKYTDEGAAILQTYMQGYTKYPPAKMILFKKAFDCMRVRESTLWEGKRDLGAFLKKHKNIPPIWRWDADMEQEGKELLLQFYPRYLDAVFELHSRGTLDEVQRFAQSEAPKEQDFSFIKGFLSTQHAVCLKDFSLFLKRKHENMRKEKDAWIVVQKCVADVIQHIHYDIEADSFSWVEEPEKRPDLIESLKYPDRVKTIEAYEACVLKKRYPSLSTLGLIFVLKSRGITANPDALRIQFAALEVLRLVPRHKNETIFMEKCCKCFGFYKQDPNGYTKEQVDKIFKSTTHNQNNYRIKRVVLEALRLCQDDHLKTLLQEKKVVRMSVIKCAGPALPPAKKQKLDASVAMHEESFDDEHYDPDQDGFCLNALVLAAELTKKLSSEDAKSLWRCVSQGDGVS